RARCVLDQGGATNIMTRTTGSERRLAVIGHACPTSARLPPVVRRRPSSSRGPSRLPGGEQRVRRNQASTPTDFGKLAIVVGIDGAGKSTIIRRLAGIGYATSHWRMLAHLDANLAPLVNNASEVMFSLRGRDRTDFLLKLVKAEWAASIRPLLAA